MSPVLSVAVKTISDVMMTATGIASAAVIMNMVSEALAYLCIRMRGRRWIRN